MTDSRSNLKRLEPTSINSCGWMTIIIGKKEYTYFGVSDKEYRKIIRMCNRYKNTGVGYGRVIQYIKKFSRKEMVCT